MSQRVLRHTERGGHGIDGAGVHLRRVLGNHTVEMFDPFLMLDGFDSTDPNDYIKGFPFHPHRGIETVTYLISGDIEHQDGLGNKGSINDLCCQWMTAGSGIIHQEMPRAVPRMLGLQLWVNLPQKDKMANPAYGDIRAEDIPVVQEENAEIRVLSGNYKNVQGAFQGKYVSVRYLDVKLNPDAQWSFDGAKNKETLFLYLIDGNLAGDKNLTQFEDKACAMLFEAHNQNPEEHDRVIVKAGKDGARFMLLSAEPLREDVAWGGPIVMNTREELRQAFRELEEGTFIKHTAA